MQPVSMVAISKTNRLELKAQGLAKYSVRAFLNPRLRPRDCVNFRYNQTASLYHFFTPLIRNTRVKTPLPAPPVSTRL